MSTGTIVAIVIVVVVLAALVALGVLSARRRRLQKRFGPEYDRAVQDNSSKLKAEAKLAEREKRVKSLDIRPLNPAARDRYAADWTAIQEQFVDSPSDAVTGAQSLITSVMQDRGYPTDNTDQILADLSVEHADTLGHYRTAQDLSSRATDGTASTEDLRLAMVHYRTLFQGLLGGVDGTPEAEADAQAAAAADYPPAGASEDPEADAPVTVPAVTDPAADPAVEAPAADSDTTDSDTTDYDSTPATATDAAPVDDPDAAEGQDDVARAAPAAPADSDLTDRDDPASTDVPADEDPEADPATPAGASRLQRRR